MSVSKPADAIPSYTSAELNLVSGQVARVLRERGVRVSIANIRAVLEEGWPYIVDPVLMAHTPRRLGEDETICDWCGTRWPCETATGAGVV